MSDGTYRRLATAVIIAHQRTGPASCLCGSLPFGSSYAEHVAARLERVGALNSPPRDRAASVTTDVLTAELEARGVPVRVWVKDSP